MSAIVNDLMLVAVFMLIGLALRELVKPLRDFYLPAGLIGGVIALIAGPQVLGIYTTPETWSGMSSPMINLVLTCQIFGTVFSKDKASKYLGATLVCYLTYFAQMFFGTLTGIGLSKVWSDLPECWGVMAIFTYWGGHGAATSSGTLFEELGAEGMLSIGIILATLGLITAMVVGMVLVNYEIRKGNCPNLPKDSTGKIAAMHGPVPAEKSKSLGRTTVAADAVNSMMLQFAFVLFSMWVGAKLFGFIKSVIPAASNIPSLLYGIVGGALVWFVMCKLHLDGYVDKASVNTISGVALEICIFTATATLNLKLFAEFLAPILIHMVVILAIMVFICTKIVPRWLKTDWVELAVYFFGQGTGSSPSGMALARCVDPETKNGNGWEAMGVAAGLSSPVSSTLVAIIPILALQSAWIPVGIGLGVSLVIIVLGELLSKKS